MSIVNTQTGEITEPGTSLAPLDKNAASVVTVLENAKAWLSTAVELTGPEEIAAAKAQIRTAETYARELHLSKDIQLDAQEMVRRAEYALGKSIRKGQAEGTVRRRGQVENRANQHGRVGESVDKTLSSPYDFAPHHELHGQSAQANGIYDMADHAETDEDFDAALTEAKSEGNLSRANVARKVKKQAGPTTRDERADLIFELAEQGYSSRQIAPKVGVSDAWVRQTARDYSIEIPADKVIGKTRRLDSTRIVEAIVSDLEATQASIDLIDYSTLDREQAGQWANSLDESLKVLNRFRKQIKELTQ